MQRHGQRRAEGRSDGTGCLSRGLVRRPARQRARIQAAHSPLEGTCPPFSFYHTSHEPWRALATALAPARRSPEDLRRPTSPPTPRESAANPLPPALALAQAFGVTAATVATFIIGADHAARQYELSQYQLGSGTELSKVAHQAEQAEQSLGLDKYGRPQQQRAGSQASTSEALMAWGTENKYKVVFGAWAASMVGSFGCKCRFASVA